MAGLIYALDADTIEDAISWAKRLASEVDAFKVGYKLFGAAGPQAVDALHKETGARIFLDLKFHDIPFTVASVAAEVAKLGVFMFNVHASGGEAMMRAAKESALESAQKADLKPPKVIAVTLLTSMSSDDVKKVGLDGELLDVVLRFAELTKAAGLDGVVASVQEAAHIRKAIGEDFMIVTPGIRLSTSPSDDQARTATPEGAVKAGADWIVVGRPIRDADDPVAAARSIKASLTQDD